jgi:glucosamine-6-phosphate deaminase
VHLDQAKIFNLDEYCGLAASDPHSFAGYLHRHLISPLNVRSEQMRLIRGDAANIALECRDYDAAIADWGGIDLCVLGLGANGHIAFNEPGTPWELRTHVATLSAGTRAAQRGAWKVPERGITMGIATLIDARQILLLIAGPGKSAATAALHRGVPSIDWPVTSLASHPALTVIRLGEAAENR